MISPLIEFFLRTGEFLFFSQTTMRITECGEVNQTHPDPEAETLTWGTPTILTSRFARIKKLCLPMNSAKVKFNQSFPSRRQVISINRLYIVNVLMILYHTLQRSRKVASLGKVGHIYTHSHVSGISEPWHISYCLLNFKHPRRLEKCLLGISNCEMWG